MDLQLNNKRVLVTASSSGIGYATVKAFLDEGAIVFMNGQNKQKLEQNAMKLQDIYGADKVYYFSGNILKKKILKS